MPNNNPNGGAQWLPEHSDELRALVECEKPGSYTAIAAAINAKFGTSYNRNATIGKANRMGLDKKPAVSVPGNRKPRTRTSSEFGSERRVKNKYETIRIIAANGNSNAMRVIRTVSTDRPALACVEVAPLNLTLLDLEADQCRQPYGDGPFLFCGHPSMKGSSYCGPHHFQNWVKPDKPLTLARKYHGTNFARGAVA